MRVGLIGLGAIGRGVVRLLGPADDVEMVGALVANPRASREIGSPTVTSATCASRFATSRPTTIHGRLVAKSIVHALRQRHARLVVG